MKSISYYKFADRFLACLTCGVQLLEHFSPVHNLTNTTSHYIYFLISPAIIHKVNAYNAIIYNSTFHETFAEQ